MNDLKIVETFKSLEGEGIRTGLPTVFVRFAGCNLRCSWCDTTYSHTKPEYTVMTKEELTAKILSYNIKRITFTGGEPLLDEPMQYIKWFVKEFPSYEVNIETNGSVYIPDELLHAHNTIITMDYKCPSSNMNAFMIRYDYEGKYFHNSLRPQDVLKFVVADDTDLQVVLDFVTTRNLKCSIYLSPVFGKMDLQKLANFVISHADLNLRMGIQIHKIIWSPETRGV